MNIFVLTSSRADYGIYKPLLTNLESDSFFKLNIVAFGTHLSQRFGNTVKQIEADGFAVDHKLNTAPTNDTPFAIAESMGNTMLQFSTFWEKVNGQADMIICLGDRYEMFAAVSASIPFGIPVAHIHGGETTEGAIDNSFRHALTHMACCHFVSTQVHAQKVKQLTGTEKNIYNVGALSLENILQIKFMSDEEIEKFFSIPVDNPVLVTFHPETVNYDKNKTYIEELIGALNAIEGQIVITMPNADTMGNLIREKIIEFSKSNKRVFIVESFGTVGYFSVMRQCRFVLGNSSSGIIEAASFGKYVINVGDRQKSREAGANVLHCEIKKESILEKTRLIQTLPHPGTENIYGGGKTSQKIVDLIKQLTINKV